MDFQKYIDGFYAISCLLSVEKKEDGGYGDIRIVAGNRKFVEMVEHPPYAMDAGMPEIKFEPDSMYDRYLPKTPDFEDKCFRSAIQKKPIHNYIHLNVVELWFNMFFTPVDYEDGNKCYCVYSYDPVSVDEIDMAVTSSMTTSNDVLKTCIKLRGATDFKKAMNEVIKDVRELCGAEVCTVLLVNQEEATSSILAASKAEDSTIRTLSQSEYMYDVAMSWADTIGERDSIIVKNEKDFEYVKEVNYPWYQTLVDSNVKSIVVFPLRHNRELLGFIWTTNFNVDDVQRIKETLELTTFFISSEIASYMMLKQLERISYIDLLTGIKNRNSMNNHVTGIVSGEQLIEKPYAVIFADLNGLKRVNDENGHSAGDLLLKKAGLILQEIFVDDDVYRAGGDEFMVIVSGDRESFDKKIAELRARASDPDNVCLSFGYYFNDTDMDIRDAMRIADEEMYKDKEKYYEEHPERRYR
jgi:diguanylate cyclase (GGDEF)-like protein